MLYTLTSHSLVISIIPFYQEDLSNPEEEHYVWSYNVRIENKSKKTVRILGRKWKVVDAIGREENIIAPGVIGPAMKKAQSILKAGKSLEYTSEAHLATSSGIITGSYTVQFDGKEEVLEADLPPFSLDIPDMRICLH
jgi:ApaG protein